MESLHFFNLGSMRADFKPESADLGPGAEKTDFRFEMHTSGLRGQISLISALRGWISGQRGQITGQRGPIWGLKGQIWGPRGQITGIGR